MTRRSLVQCYLSTSYYLMPFLHVPSFLAVSVSFGVVSYDRDVTHLDRIMGTRGNGASPDLLRSSSLYAACLRDILTTPACARIRTTATARGRSGSTC